jgi:hypothetical protein
MITLYLSIMICGISFGVTNILRQAFMIMFMLIFKCLSFLNGYGSQVVWWKLRCLDGCYYQIGWILGTYFSAGIGRSQMIPIASFVPYGFVRIAFSCSLSAILVRGFGIIFRLSGIILMMICNWFGACKEKFSTSLLHASSCHGLLEHVANREW